MQTRLLTAEGYRFFHIFQICGKCIGEREQDCVAGILDHEDMDSLPNLSVQQNIEYQ